MVYQYCRNREGQDQPCGSVNVLTQVILISRIYSSGISYTGIWGDTGFCLGFNTRNRTYPLVSKPTIVSSLTATVANIDLLGAAKQNGSQNS